MIDIHTHILPGVDDGSPDIGDSLEMAAMAARSGTKVLVATPHCNQMGRFENFFGSELKERFQRLQRHVKEEGINLQLLLGMEIFSSDDMGAKIRDGSLIGLNGTDYYLVEWFFDSSPEQIRFYLNQVLKEGKTPLIAHPERYYCVQDYPELVYDWLRMGCYTQINKGSLSGKFGRHAEETAKYMLENDLVTCVASDAHSPYRRTTDMSVEADYLTDRYGERYKMRLMRENPMRILNNQKVPTHGFIK